MKSISPLLVSIIVLAPVFLVLAENDRKPASEKPDIGNFRRVNQQLCFGGEPKNDLAFEQLAKSGIKIIVSVDGSRPKIELAKKHRLKYVHIPIGYDGIDQQAMASFTKVARSIKEPIYVHCHHGKHRAPTAVAILLQVQKQCGPSQALQILKDAGTDPDYSGLWQAVENYKPLGQKLQLPDLVEVADVPPLAKSMAKLDKTNDELTRLLKSKSSIRSARAMALSLSESLHELHRINKSEIQIDAGYTQLLEESNRIAKDIYTQLKGDHLLKAIEKHKLLTKKCVTCHQKYRN